MSDQSDSENEAIINLGVLSVFRHRKRIEDKTVISPQLFQKLQECLTCPICLEIFQEAVYVKDCSHRFCKQCIEKYIRSQEYKSCPTCRKKIGTKRQLRDDESILLLMNQVFGDVEKYRALEEQARQEQLPLVVKRLRQQKLEEESRALRKIPRKRIKDNNEESIDVETVDEDDHKKRQLAKENAGLPFSITIQLQKHPDNAWLLQMKDNILFLPWSFSTKELAQKVCRSTGLNPDKYVNNLKFYVKTNNQFSEVEQGTTLESLNRTHWEYYKDIDLYDAQASLKKVALKDFQQNAGVKRILYFDLENIKIY